MPSSVRNEQQSTGLARSGQQHRLLHWPMSYDSFRPLLSLITDTSKRHRRQTIELVDWLSTGAPAPCFADHLARPRPLSKPARHSKELFQTGRGREARAAKAALVSSMAISHPFGFLDRPKCGWMKATLPVVVRHLRPVAIAARISHSRIVKRVSPSVPRNHVLMGFGVTGFGTCRRCHCARSDNSSSEQKSTHEG
jgi:hypothetical protein